MENGLVMIISSNNIYVVPPLNEKHVIRIENKVKNQTEAVHLDLPYFFRVVRQRVFLPKQPQKSRSVL